MLNVVNARSNSAPIYRFAQFIASFEIRHVLSRDADFFTGLGIASNARLSVIQIACPEASYLHPMSVPQGIGNNHKNFRDSHFSIGSQKLREALGQNCREFRSSHSDYFNQGCFTSRLGKTTSRSQVPKLMASKKATPYILRSQCIQHDSAFVAAIRPLAPDALSGMPRPTD